GHLAGEEGQGQQLGDIAYTLQVGRNTFTNRRVAVARAAADAASACGGLPAGGATLLARRDPTKGRRTAFLFAGVGEHYEGMVADLYRSEPTFRRHLDDGQKVLSEYAPIDVVPPLTTPGSAAGAGDLAAMLGRAPRADAG